MILMGSGVGVVIEAWKVIYFYQSYTPLLTIKKKKDYKSRWYKIDTVTAGVFIALQAWYQRYDNCFLLQNKTGRHYV